MDENVRGLKDKIYLVQKFNFRFSHFFSVKPKIHNPLLYFRTRISRAYMASGGYWTLGPCCWIGQCLSLPHKPPGDPNSKRIEASLSLYHQQASGGTKKRSGDFFTFFLERQAELSCTPSLPRRSGLAGTDSMWHPVTLPKAIASTGTVVLSLTLELGRKVLQMTGASRFCFTRLGWRHGWAESYLWP